MKQAKIIQEACDHLIKQVRFETAGFELPPGLHQGGYLQSEQDTAIIREATKLYTETWVVPVIEAIRDANLYLLRNLIK